MANQRLPMRKIKEVLRLKYDCLRTQREIAQSCGLAQSTVCEILKKAQDLGLAWPIPEELNDQALELKLFKSPSLPDPRHRSPPDYEYVQRELQDHKKFNLTLYQLWLEYKEQYPTGYQYTQFCEHYHRWRHKLDYCMRQEHKAGEKLFIDYGDGLSIVDPKTGEFIPTQLFVAVWGASNYTYAEAALNQTLPSWTRSHVNAFNYFGCVPRVLVPDCLKSGVTVACFYEPEINPTYADLARHYGTVVLPARPHHPRDKAAVENGVLISKRWILSVLRHRVFYSLAELNAAIRELLEILNARLLRKRKQSRRQLFEQIDHPAALTLPQEPYEYAEWRRAGVNIDYHVEVDRHYYSVPFSLLREKLDVRLTYSTVEFLLKGERMAAHLRSYQPHRHTTLKEHMPPEHRKYVEWTPTRIIEWARKTGPATAQVAANILESRTYPEQAYRSCLGILRLGQSFGANRLEAASLRAVQFHTCSYKAIRSILEKGLDRQTQTSKDSQQTLPLHDNVRGGEYFN